MEKREYLIDLREQHRSTKGSPNQVRIGEVVLVHEDNVKRSQWEMEKVLEHITGRDGEVRGAKLKLISKGKAV